MTHWLVRVPEAAATLGISRSKMYELLAAGQIPSVKVDGCRRIRSTDLEAYIDALPVVPLRAADGRLHGKN